MMAVVVMAVVVMAVVVVAAAAMAAAIAVRIVVTETVIAARRVAAVVERRPQYVCIETACRYITWVENVRAHISEYVCACKCASAGHTVCSYGFTWCLSHARWHVHLLEGVKHGDGHFGWGDKRSEVQLTGTGLAPIRGCSKSYCCPYEIVDISLKLPDTFRLLSIIVVDFRVGIWVNGYGWVNALGMRTFPIYDMISLSHSRFPLFY